MFYFVLFVSLLALAGVVLTLRAIGNLVLVVADLRAYITERSSSLVKLDAGLHSLTRKQLRENAVQHRITRSYLVTILEKTLLPHLGYKEPERTPWERQALEAWKSEVTDNEADA